MAEHFSTEKPTIVDPGSPQPDDVEKMESFLKAVYENSEAKQAWGGAEVPANGFTGGTKMIHQFVLRTALSQYGLPKAQEMRVCDLIQDKYDF